MVITLLTFQKNHPRRRRESRVSTKETRNSIYHILVRVRFSGRGRHVGRRRVGARGRRIGLFGRYLVDGRGGYLVGRLCGGVGLCGGRLIVGRLLSYLCCCYCPWCCCVAGGVLDPDAEEGQNQVDSPYTTTPLPLPTVHQEFQHPQESCLNPPHPPPTPPQRPILLHINSKPFIQLISGSVLDMHEGRRVLDGDGVIQ